MPTATIQEATNLSKLIEQAERGEEVLIARGKQAVARIVPVGARRKKRKLDILRGKFKLRGNSSRLLPTVNCSRGAIDARSCRHACVTLGRNR